MRALICGITGQDGSYLAKLLVEKGYEVIGTSRDVMVASVENLRRLGIEDKVKLASMAISDFRSVLTVIQKQNPDEIYNLAGQTSVGLSFDQPVEAMESISLGTLNILEAIRLSDSQFDFITLDQANVSEISATQQQLTKTRRSVREVLCGRQIVCSLASYELSRSLWFVRVHRYFVQS